MWKAEWTLLNDDGPNGRRTTKYFKSELDAFNYMSTVHDHLAFLGLRDLLVDDSITLELDSE